MAARSTILLVAICLVVIHIHQHTSAFVLRRSSRFSIDKSSKVLSMKAGRSSSHNPPKEGGNRKMRRVLEAQVRARFLDGEDLEKLRLNITNMKEKLEYLKALYATTGRNIDTDDFAVALRDAIARSERRDPDIEYIRTLSALESAKREYSNELIASLSKEAIMVRQCIPRLNLQGLWITESTSSKPLMINVTYVGDILLATAIAMSGRIHKGDLLLRADLSFINALEPIRISGEVAEQWGKERLTLYPGKAQPHNASGCDWIQGNFFLCKEDMFGFIFLAAKQHIIFRRPKAKQIFKLIQDGIIHDKKQKEMSAYLERCYNLKDSQTQRDGLGIKFRQLKRWGDDIE